MQYNNFFKVAHSAQEDLAYLHSALEAQHSALSSLLDAHHSHGPAGSCALCTDVGHTLSDTLRLMRHPGLSSKLDNALDVLRRAVPATRSDNALTTPGYVGDNFSGPINISWDVLKSLDESRKGLIADDEPKNRGLTDEPTDEPTV
jgi:hypothetical protein